MKTILLIFSFISITGFSQSQDCYNQTVNQLKIEAQLLEEIKKDYEHTIDSLYCLNQTDSTQSITNQLMVDYYTLKTNHLKEEMKQMVILIDALNTIKKED